MAGRVGRGRVQAIIISSSSYSFNILHGIVLYIFRFKINTLLCYVVVSVFVLGIDIARGQYYWILDIGCLVWYRSDPTPSLCVMGAPRKRQIHSALVLKWF